VFAVILFINTFFFSPQVSLEDAYQSPGMYYWRVGPIQHVAQLHYSPPWRCYAWLYLPLLSRYPEQAKHEIKTTELHFAISSIIPYNIPTRSSNTTRPIIQAPSFCNQTHSEFLYLVLCALALVRVRRVVHSMAAGCTHCLCGKRSR
jgi:hypothetical protein